MKKFAIFLCAVLCLFSAFGCAPTKSDNLVLVCPDGAPAISAFALKGVNGIDFSVYPSSTAPTSITQDIRKKSTDIAILPVNLASKLCASGEDYKMVGVLTHGNLYGVSDDGVTLENIKGKSVGVIQLNSVPGYTVKLLLKSLDIPYTDNESEKTSDNVYLFPLNADATAVKSALDSDKADLCIVAEPMCARLVSAFSFTRTVDVQSAYGSFPQAVMVIKTSVLNAKKDKVNEIISALDGYDYTALNPTSLVDWINLKITEGATSSLSPVALTEEALAKSNIRYENASSQRERVKNYLTALKIFDTPLGTVAENVSDEFFWSNV
jgi:hypothetical protein